MLKFLFAILLEEHLLSSFLCEIAQQQKKKDLKTSCESVRHRRYPMTCIWVNPNIFVKKRSEKSLCLNLPQFKNVNKDVKTVCKSIKIFTNQKTKSNKKKESNIFYL